MSKSRKTTRSDKKYQAIANPIARAAHRARMQKWLEKRTDQIETMRNGDDCAEFLAAVLDELAVCLKACEGFEVPDWVVDDLLASVEVLQGMAQRGAVWDSIHAGLLRSTLACAVQINCRMPFERIAHGSAWVRSATAVAQAVGVAA